MSEYVIPPGEATYHSLSSGDSNGRLFYWKGSLYRGFAGQREPNCRRLFRDGIVARLVERRLLVETEMTNLCTAEYPVVIKHHELPFVSYPSEWCGPMLRDAALLVIDLALDLADHDLMLHDAHPWNVVFDGTKPYYVDFHSFVPRKSPYFPYGEFTQFFLTPLRLMGRGQSEIARWVLSDFLVAPSTYEYLARSDITPKASFTRLVEKGKRHLRCWFPPAQTAGRLIRRARGYLSSTAENGDRFVKDLSKLRQDVEHMNFPKPPTMWSEYYDRFDPLTPSPAWNAKERRVHDVLSKIRPRTLLDVGSNRGWYSVVAASLGAKVVALDTDEVCIMNMYETIKHSTMDIQPLIMNIRKPTPGYGICNQELPPASARLGCEMVLALALVHHLVYKDRLQLDQVADALSGFAGKWLLVEFIPAEDQYVRQWQANSPGVYTLEAFQNSLRRHFPHQTTAPSFPEPRVLILCSREADAGCVFSR